MNKKEPEEEKPMRMSLRPQTPFKLNRAQRRARAKDLMKKMRKEKKRLELTEQRKDEKANKKEKKDVRETDKRKAS